MENLLLISSGAIVDIVALIFLLGFTILGFVRGFAKSFVSLFGTLLSFIFAILLSPAVSRFLESQFSLVGSISTSLESTLGKLFGEGIMNTTLGEATESSLGDAGLAGWIISIVLVFKKDVEIPTGVTLNQLLCPTIAYYVVIIIAVVIIFILFKTLFFLLSVLIKKLYVVKFIKVSDRFLGLILGVISGIMYLDGIILIISIIPLGFVQDLYAHILSSGFTMFIHNINLFGRIMNAVSINDVVAFVKDVVVSQLKTTKIV